jgi:hypothetical protein
MNMKSALRFDHREIAVIFSLFIFVSLLMFTVGILVGKGLTQAKYEGHAPGHAVPKIESLSRTRSEPGSSVSMGARHESAPAHHEAKAETPAPAHGETPAQPAPAATAAPRTTASLPPLESTGPMKLVPLRPSATETNGTNLSATETDALLKNPKILSLIEDDESPVRTPNSVSPGKGSFTVQVGSYPNETAARERVDALKKMGYPQAFFSASELGSSKGTWYRVWAGQYSDYQSAKKTGDQLQGRGEVKNYIVRKN